VFIILGRIHIANIAVGSACCNGCLLVCRACSAIFYIGCSSGNDFLLLSVLESVFICYAVELFDPLCKRHFAASATNQRNTAITILEVSDAANGLITFEKFI